MSLNTNEKIHKRSIKKIDAVVTGMLLGWIVASIYGIKKTNDHLSEKEKEKQEISKSRTKNILKMLIFGCEEPVVEKKKGFFSRLFKQ